MSVSWRNKCLLLSFLALVLVAESSRLSNAHIWEQMLPKKLPSPSSAPSRGTNSATTSLKTEETDQRLPSEGGKV